MQFQAQDVIEITDGPASILVAPQYGGRLLRWRVGTRDIIRWPDDADWSQAARVRGGNPLLFPFLGRHWVDGEIDHWRDAAGRVRVVPMHGFARDLPFHSELDADHLGLRVKLTDSAATHAGYPFEFEFEAAYRLSHEGDTAALEVVLTTRNTGAEPLPYYAGHHFYFSLPHALRADTTLTLPPNRTQYQKPGGALTAVLGGTLSHTMDDPALLDRFHILETPGVASLVTPSLGRTIDLELDQADSIPWYAVTTWTEAPESDFYCVEPWLGLPDAIHNQQGLRWLAPGQHESARLRLTVRDAI